MPRPLIADRPLTSTERTQRIRNRDKATLSELRAALAWISAEARTLSEARRIAIKALVAEGKQP